MPCMLALEEVTRKDKGEDDNDEENHNEDDVQVHRGYSSGHHRFWENNLSKPKGMELKYTSQNRFDIKLQVKSNGFLETFIIIVDKQWAAYRYNRTTLDKMPNVML